MCAGIDPREYVGKEEVVAGPIGLDQTLGVDEWIDALLLSRFLLDHGEQDFLSLDTLHQVLADVLAHQQMRDVCVEDKVLVGFGEAPRATH